MFFFSVPRRSLPPPDARLPIRQDADRRPCGAVSRSVISQEDRDISATISPGSCQRHDQN